MVSIDSMMDEYKAAQLASLKAQADTSSAEAYMSEFQAAVLAHLNTQIDDDSWKRFRDVSVSGVIEDPIEGSESWTREQLVEGGTMLGGGSVQEICSAFEKSHINVIGMIQNRPIHFVAEQGIYMWALTDDTSDSLELWITCPAYPPGW